MEEETDTAYRQENIGSLFRAIGTLGDRLTGTVEELLRRTAALEYEGQQLRASVVELEERLADLFSQRTVSRTDLHNGTHLAHLNLAADYRSLVMQWMQRVARKVARQRSRETFEYDLGRQVASFTNYLFRGDQPDAEGLLSSLESTDPDTFHLAESMCARANSLRKKIADIGVHHEWDFRTELSDVLNDERQEAWLTCDPSKPVILIVAPAYLVQGVLYAKQLVVTGRSRPGTSR